MAASDTLQIDQFRDLIAFAKGNKSDTSRDDLLKLAKEAILRDEMLREGHDLLNAVMMRSGLIFKLQEHGDIIAKVKAWNLRVRHAGIIKIVSGEAR